MAKSKGFPNRIREFRTKLGWTQAELAKKARTSQQQVQRWESGQHQVRLASAAAVAKVLGQEIERVFPYLNRISAAGKLAAPPLTLQGPERSGPRLGSPTTRWTLRFEVRGFPEPFIFSVSKREADRIYGRFLNATYDDEPRASFAVFDTTDDLVVAINAREMHVCQILWDPNWVDMPPRPNSPESESAMPKDPGLIQSDYLNVLMVNNAEQYVVHPPYEEEAQCFFGDLENAYMDDCPFSKITDEDGEAMIFRRENIAVAVAPHELTCVEDEDE